VKSGAIETRVPETAEPWVGKVRCPNGHDSSIRPRRPALMLWPAITTAQKRSGTSSASHAVFAMSHS
jgi:hypothetical protein